MNTSTATNRQPTNDPFLRVHVDGMNVRTFGLPAPATCQAITGTGHACTHTAVAKAWGRGPRMSAQVALCRTHAASRYLVSADPSL